MILDKTHGRAPADQPYRSAGIAAEELARPEPGRGAIFQRTFAALPRGKVGEGGLKKIE